MNYELFLSYRREDKQVVDFFYNDLSDQKHRVFYDTQSLLSGDFTQEIKTAIQESELVVSILTCQSIKRMVETQNDMVRLELETAREAQKAILFLWLTNNFEQSQLYDQMTVYAEDEFIVWLSRQNIIPFTSKSDSIKKMNDKILETLEFEVRKKFDAIRQISKKEKDTCLKFTINGKQYEYHGTSRYSSWEKNFLPYQEGVLIDAANPFAVKVYEGTWDGSDMFLGEGQVYLEQNDQRKLVYQGSWLKLQYHDNDGKIYNEKGDCIYHGCLIEGEKALYGEEIFEDGTTFRGWYKNNKPLTGDMRYSNGDAFAGKFRNNKPDGFGRMLYAEGGSYEGDWMEGSPYGNGTLIYKHLGSEIWYSGGFSKGKKTGCKRGFPMEVKIKKIGDQNFRRVFFSEDESRFDGVFSGHGEFTYSDGSKYIGKWSNGKKASGYLVENGQSIQIENNIPCGITMDKQLWDRLLCLMDEEWRVLHLLAKKSNDICFEIEYIYSKNYGGLLGDFVSEYANKLEFECSQLSIEEYPFGQPLIQRLAVFVQLPPSLRVRLPQEELSNIGELLRKEFQRRNNEDSMGLDFSQLDKQAAEGFQIEEKTSDKTEGRIDWSEFFGR